MNSARSPSGSHSRMSGGSNNRWSCEYGRNRWLMPHTLRAIASITQRFSLRQAPSSVSCDRQLSEICSADALVGQELARGSGDRQASRLEHVRSIRNMEGETGVLLDEQERDAGREENAVDLQNVVHDQSPQPERRT